MSLFVFSQLKDNDARAQLAAPYYIMMETLVIGLGNPILTDDAVGILVARAVQAALPDSVAVDVIELSVGGLALMEAMIGYQRVFVIDAYWTPTGQPGEIVEFYVDALDATLNTASAHDVNLMTALELGRDLGAMLPANKHIHIIGVQAQEVLTFGETLTPSVAAAIPKVTERILELLSGGYDDFS